MRTLLAILCPALDRRDSMRSPDGSSAASPFFRDAYLEVLQVMIATLTEEGAFSLCSSAELLADVGFHLSHDSDPFDYGEGVLSVLIFLILLCHVPNGQEVDSSGN